MQTVTQIIALFDLKSTTASNSKPRNTGAPKKKLNVSNLQTAASKTNIFQGSLQAWDSSNPAVWRIQLQTKKTRTGLMKTTTNFKTCWLQKVQHIRFSWCNHPVRREKQPSGWHVAFSSASSETSRMNGGRPLLRKPNFARILATTRASMKL